MISVCIPVYNTDVRQLVLALDKQASEYGLPYEIILLDDASTLAHTQEQNNSLSSISNLRIFKNESNIGLARTRNRLGSLAQYPYLLFIDSDAQIVSNDYWQTYIRFCNPTTVIFGGCMYSAQCPDKKFILRWKFGKEREEGVGKYFSCFNFLIPKDIFEKYPFSEQLHQYGYEDTLFGITLKHTGTEVLFIDNALLHTGLDSADVYLKKVELSIQNLIRIEPLLKAVNGSRQIKLLRLYYSMRYLSTPTALLFRLLQKILHAHLTGNNPSLRILDFYKLGYLCNLKQRTKTSNQ